MSLPAALVSPAKEKKLGCQADFGYASPPDDLMSLDIAGKGPQQIEIAAHVAYEVVANLEANISHVGLRM